MTASIEINSIDIKTRGVRNFARAASRNDLAAAAQANADDRQLAVAAAPDLKLAEPCSLFNPAARKAHFAALRQLASLAQINSRPVPAHEAH